MPELDGMSQACLYDTHIGLELRTCKEPGCTCVCHPVTDGQAVPPPAAQRAETLSTALSRVRKLSVPETGSQALSGQRGAL